MAETPVVSGVFSERWRPVGLVAGWQTAASLCYYSIFAATDFVRNTFALSESLVGLFLAAALIGYTLALFPSGAAVDGYGERPVMIVGLLGLAAAAVGVSFAPTYLTILIAAGVLGAAYSTAMPASNRGIVANAPAGQANLAMGLKQVGVTTGSAAASIVITGVAAVVVWPVGFWIIAIIAGGYTLGFGRTYTGKPGSGEITIPDMWGLIKGRRYALLIVAGLFIGASIFSMLGYIVLYVVDVVRLGSRVGNLGITATIIGGGVLALTQLTGSAARIAAGSLADRLRSHQMADSQGSALVAAAQLTLGTVLFITLAVGPQSILVVIVAFIGLGLSIHGSPGVFYSCLADLVDDTELGAATAGGQIAINIGGVLTPPLFGIIVETSGYNLAWVLLAGLSGIAAVLLGLIVYISR
ncbi:MFS transporter [Haloquadratum walsbyi]|jgi:Sugar phosphate permease|uniref:Sugar phosphate permease n=1 Tax=Haloquadratum walsbyi J07HQW2 TaxID=1238425 RepID=U1NGE7_9EURY|nr:MFS transporter [Haloquadratum walsbyi]ERG95878.1 MAG: sugar phosphate permease [Haloquadratum walsbyi J07HQW2]